MRELQKEVTLDEVDDILGTTIKEDRENKQITFLYVLLNYTKENQQNIIFKAESSTGKTYIPSEIAKYFPKRDIVKLANCTPTAFYHEYGKYDKETHTKLINLHQKILIFQEQRNSALLKELRPLLSHDSKIITTKRTDRNKRHGHATKTVAIIGFPTVIFCSAGAFLQEQELTRCIILSPEATEKKLQASIELLFEKLSNPTEFQKWLKEDNRREWLTNRINQIKTASISQIMIPENLKLQVYCQFKEDHPYLAPRLQRDIPRLLALIKAHALLNLFHREQIIEGTEKILVANHRDVAEGYTLYKHIAESNELGLTPETYEIWKNVIQPEINPGLRKSQIALYYFQKYHRHLSKRRLDNTLTELLASGLIYKDKDEQDGRINIYKSLEIYSPEGVTTSPSNKNDSFSRTL